MEKLANSVYLGANLRCTGILSFKLSFPHTCRILKWPFATDFSWQSRRLCLGKLPPGHLHMSALRWKVRVVFNRESMLMPFVRGEHVWLCSCIIPASLVITARGEGGRGESMCRINARCNYNAHLH